MSGDRNQLKTSILTPAGQKMDAEYTTSPAHARQTGKS